MGKLIPQTEPTSIAPEVVAYAEQCRVAFGLEYWNIWLYEHDAPGGSPNTAGHVHLDTRYLRAHITLLRGLKPDRQRSVMRHEMLHVALARIDQAVRTIVAMLPEEEHERAKDIYTDMEEQTIELLVRSLETLIGPPAPDSLSIQ